MSNEELAKIENEIIKMLNWHKNELDQARVFLEKEGSSGHLTFIENYEQGAIAAMKDCIDVIRKHYRRVL